ncbi:DedA family protein [Fimbriiglobus ruber]|uniref:DedA protein n=1 Tax=Fimbriiglobus ruber TaxID=1908690 RepID=A0A225EB65_9BACT|nr:DedA family protein [Fimbriiglobus ruber]OWK47276.1 DedA protein [Fimbriiglobus ruber]
MFTGVTLSKYGGVLAALILAGFGAPIPEEIPIVTAGAMVGHDSQDRIHPELAGVIGGGPVVYLTPVPEGITHWWIMLPLCILGVVIGDTVLFGVGRLYGVRLLNWGWFQRRILPPDKRLQIEANFAKNGIMILLGARFTPGIRTPVFVMAGVLRMPLSRFLLADGLYAIPGVTILFSLSFWFTDQFVEAVKAVDRHRPLAILAVLSAVIGVAIYKFATTRRLSTGSMEEIPAYAKPMGAVTHAIEKTIEKTVGKTIETTVHVLDKVTHHGHGKGTASVDSEPVHTEVPAVPAAMPQAPPLSD